MCHKKSPLVYYAWKFHAMSGRIHFIWEFQFQSIALTWSQCSYFFKVTNIIIVLDMKNKFNVFWALLCPKKVLTLTQYCYYWFWHLFVTVVVVFPSGNLVEEVAGCSITTFNLLRWVNTKYHWVWQAKNVKHVQSMYTLSDKKMFTKPKLNNCKDLPII